MPVGTVCHWTPHEDNDQRSWSTGCGDEFYGDGGTLEEYGFKWCPFCAAAIRFIPPKQED